MNLVSEINWMFQASTEWDETRGHKILTIPNHLKREQSLNYTIMLFGVIQQETVSYSFAVMLIQEWMAYNKMIVGC